MVDLSKYEGIFLTSEGLRKYRDKKKAQSSVAQEGDAIHAMIQGEFAIKGKLQAAELPIVDLPNQMVSKLDILTKEGEAIEVKSVSLAEITIMRQPRQEHKLQLIYYLNSLSGDSEVKGYILYVAREAPGIRKIFEITKDGEARELGAAAIKYMQLRRGGVSEAKMGAALRSAVQEFKSNQELAKDYVKNVQEARMLRRRRYLALKKKIKIKHIK